jgi:hypothetical protein
MLPTIIPLRCFDRQLRIIVFVLGVATGVAYSGGAPSSLPLAVPRIMQFISQQHSPVSIGASGLCLNFATASSLEACDWITIVLNELDGERQFLYRTRYCNNFVRGSSYGHATFYHNVVPILRDTDCLQYRLPPFLWDFFALRITYISAPSGSRTTLLKQTQAKICSENTLLLTMRRR